MNILIVEDDEFKSSDLARVIRDAIPEASVERAVSVTSALRGITKIEFALIVLDMSLPTFDFSGPGGGGSPQGQGGLEVLRLSKRLERTSPVIVISQYPDIEIDGVEVPLERAAAKLSSRFAATIVDCILYEFDSDLWRGQLLDALSSQTVRND